MAALELNARFDRFFGGASIRVQVDDSLLADAAAGSDYVKIRSGAMFSKSDVDILEAHEGWVHVATQPERAGSAGGALAGEGASAHHGGSGGARRSGGDLHLQEHPRRAKKLNDRILAVDKAEDGASFLDVFEWYRTEGYDEDECFQNARRVFRGGLLRRRRPSRRTPATARGSSSTTPSCARPFSTTGRCSFPSCSWARSRTRTSLSSMRT